MELNRLLWEVLVFVEVADAPTLKEASRRLGVAQSSVTDALDRLERRAFASNPLIVRRGRPRALTPLGESYLPIARRLADEALRLADETNRLNGQPPTVRVGTIQGAWQDLVRTAASALDTPTDLQILAIDPFKPVQPLLDGLVEWVILPAPSDHDPVLERRPIFTEPRVVSLAASHRFAEQDSVTLEQLDTLPWLGTPPGADKAFTTGHRCDDMREEPAPPSRVGPVFTNAADIGMAISTGRVIVGSTHSITSVFNTDTFGIVDVPIHGVDPWTVDLVTLRSPITSRVFDIDLFASALREATMAADGLTPYSGNSPTD